MNGIYDQCKKNGIECKIAYRYFESERYEDTVAVSSWLDCHIHNRLTKWTGLQGCFSQFRTKKFVRWIDKYDPDIVHIHNIHGSYLNFRIFFKYLQKHRCKVVITMHDCWMLTGICPHFVGYHCDKWKDECYQCPIFKGYYLNVFDPAKFLHKRKKQYITGLKDLHIIANSKWTASMASQSYLKDYPIDVIYNGIDLSIFKPTKGSIREKYDIRDNDYLILGVAFGWSEKKGLDVFIRLSELLDITSYKIMLVGVSKEQAELLPREIIAIDKTNDAKELAAIYSAADVLVNPTREEAFGLVNIEANACGTPVISFDTGGCPECINDKSGCIVPVNDINTMIAEIKRACEEKKYNSEECIKNAMRFDKYDLFAEYIKLYKQLMNYTKEGC